LIIQIGDRVVITSDCNSKGCTGTVIGDYRGGYRGVRYLMVQLDNGAKQGYNRMSVRVIKNEEELKMADYKEVAIVNLLDDYSKKDYGFALYESESRLLTKGNELVVVNARGKDNRVLGVVKKIMTSEEYGKGTTAQVVGVVNMDGFDARIEEQKRKAEIKKQKDTVEKELKERLRKLQDAAFYEDMAKKYADKDPMLTELVSKLKELGE